MGIPLSRPDVTEREIERVVQVLRSPNLSLGPTLREFEEVFAGYLGRRRAVAVQGRDRHEKNENSIKDIRPELDKCRFNGPFCHEPPGYSPQDLRGPGTEDQDNEGCDQRHPRGAYPLCSFLQKLFHVFPPVFFYFQVVGASRFDLKRR